MRYCKSIPSQLAEELQTKFTTRFEIGKDLNYRQNSEKDNYRLGFKKISCKQITPPPQPPAKKQHSNKSCLIGLHSKQMISIASFYRLPK